MVFRNVLLRKDTSCDVFQGHHSLAAHRSYCHVGVCVACPLRPVPHPHPQRPTDAPHKPCVHALSRVHTGGPGCLPMCVGVHAHTYRCAHAPLHTPPSSLPSTDMADAGMTSACPQTRCPSYPPPTHRGLEYPCSVSREESEPAPPATPCHVTIHASLPSAERLKSLISETIYLPYIYTYPCSGPCGCPRPPASPAGQRSWQITHTEECKINEA